MTETQTNRAWLIGSRLTSAAQPQRRAEPVATLLYYQSQLETELAEVKRLIAQAARGLQT